MLFNRNIALIAIITSLFIPCTGIHAETEQKETSWLLDGPKQFIGSTVSDLCKMAQSPRKHARDILKRRIRPSFEGVAQKAAHECEVELEPEDILLAQVVDIYADKFVPKDISSLAKRTITSKMKEFTQDADTISEDDTSYEATAKRIIGPWGIRHKAGLNATFDALKSKDGQFKKSFIKTFIKVLAQDTVYTYGATLVGYPGFLNYSPNSYFLTNGLRWFTRDVCDMIVDGVFSGIYNKTFDTLYDTTASVCSGAYSSVFGQSEKEIHANDTKQPQPRQRTNNRFTYLKNYAAPLAAA